MTTSKNKRIWQILSVLSLLVTVSLAIWVQEHFKPTEHITPSKPTEEAAPEGTWQKLLHDKAFMNTYALKKKINLLGFELIQLEHRQTPTQFIVVENIPSASADMLFQESLNINFIESIANQLLALRKSKQKLSLHVEKLNTLVMDKIQINEQEYRHREVSVTVQFSTEKNPRQYRGGVARRKLSADNEVLVVMYAKSPEYHPELLPALLGETTASQALLPLPSSLQREGKTSSPGEQVP